MLHINVNFAEQNSAICMDLVEHNSEICIKFAEQNVGICVDFGETQLVRVAPNPYIGPYVVIPKVDGQKLDTRGKSMADNVSIRAIPYYSVSNQSNGLTVSIASEEV